MSEAPEHPPVGKTFRFPDGYYACRIDWAGSPPKSPFAILTAWNPMDSRRSDSWNRMADRHLHHLLVRAGAEPVRATTCAMDGSHAEPGWAVALPLDTVLRIARRFHQRAIWWSDACQLHLVACSDGHRETVGPALPGN